MQTDVCIRIINEKMNKKIWAAGFSVIPAIIAFGFSNHFKCLSSVHNTDVPYV